MTTRFHAYHLGCVGVTYSYATEGYFVLVGTHYNNVCKQAILREMQIMGCRTISILSIPSWSDEYCNVHCIDSLLTELKPTTILLPRQSANGLNTLRIRNAISRYKIANPFVQIINVDRVVATKLDYRHAGSNGIVVFTPAILRMDTFAAVYRRGDLGVFDTGSNYEQQFVNNIRNQYILNRELDVLISPPSLYPNGFYDISYINFAKPTVVVICENDNITSLSMNHNPLYKKCHIYSTVSNDVVISVKDSVIGSVYELRNRLVVNKNNFVVKKR